VDTYNEGLTQYVNSYDAKSEVSANDPKEAILKYLNDFLYFDIELNEVDFDGEFIQTSILVDVDNNQPMPNEIEKWKNNELTLYCDSISLTIYELNQITF